MRTGPVFALLAGLVIAQPAEAVFTQADFQIRGFGGPKSLIAGLSGTCEFSVVNNGAVSAPLELFVIFTGAIDQTGQIVAPGLDCEVRHDKGINAAVRCTRPALARFEVANVTVQGRGQAAGTGKVGLVLNPHRSAVEDADGGYDNNNNVTIDVTIQ